MSESSAFTRARGSPLLKPCPLFLISPPPMAQPNSACRRSARTRSSICDSHPRAPRGKARMILEAYMDWSKFDLAMTDPHYLHGAPVFRAEPRMPVQAVLDNLDNGMTPVAVAEAYQIDLRLVLAVKQFAESQRLAHSLR